MQSTSAVFWKGVVHSIPFVLVIIPFGTLFGVVSADAGLDILTTVSFSMIVIAGAAQFTALSLMENQAPTLIVILTGLAVNMRMAMYSAAMAPFLGPAKLWHRVLMAYGMLDQSFALSDQAFHKHPDWPVAARVGYFAGTTIIIAPLWVACTYMGALVGTAIPDWLALDFAIPITFIALFAPVLRTKAHVAAALTSIVAALLLGFMPHGTGLLLAAFIAMAVGAEVERRTTQGAAP